MDERNCANCIHGNVCKKCSPLFGMYGCEDFMREIVRCKNCEWYDPDCEFCNFWENLRHPEHFCGEGERKDNDG